jgi:hypothetical protein
MKWFATEYSRYLSRKLITNGLRHNSEFAYGVSLCLSRTRKYGFKKGGRHELRTNRIDNRLGGEEVVWKLYALNLIDSMYATGIVPAAEKSSKQDSETVRSGCCSSYRITFRPESQAVCSQALQWRLRRNCGPNAASVPRWHPMADAS